MTKYPSSKECSLELHVFSYEMRYFFFRHWAIFRCIGRRSCFRRATDENLPIGTRRVSYEGIFLSAARLTLADWVCKQKKRSGLRKAEAVDDSLRVVEKIKEWLADRHRRSCGLLRE